MGHLAGGDWVRGAEKRDKSHPCTWAVLTRVLALTRVLVMGGLNKRSSPNDRGTLLALRSAKCQSPATTATHPRYSGVARVWRRLMPAGR